MWWFETPSLSLWRHCNGLCVIHNQNKSQNDARLSTKYHYFPLTWCIDKKQSIKVPWFMECWYPINGSNLFECHDLIQVRISTLILSIIFCVMFNTNIHVQTGKRYISSAIFKVFSALTYSLGERTIWKVYASDWPIKIPRVQSIIFGYQWKMRQFEKCTPENTRQRTK